VAAASERAQVKPMSASPSTTSRNCPLSDAWRTQLTSQVASCLPPTTSDFSTQPLVVLSARLVKACGLALVLLTRGAEAYLEKMCLLALARHYTSEYWRALACASLALSIQLAYKFS
jgi:hypothetical protein